MIEIALFGKPNAGKSSFFKAATLIDVKISPIPFTTIEPNKGIAYVSFDCACKEFNIKCNPQDGFCINGKRFAPIILWDVAGLVKDAHLGKGMGNKFLDDIRKAEALIHIVDLSGNTDENGNATENYNPENDIKFLEEEIDKWFLDILKRNLEKIKEEKKDKLIEKIYMQLSGLEIKKHDLIEIFNKFGLENLETFAKELRKRSKPIILAGNKIDLESAQKNYERLKSKYEILPVSSEYEIALKLANKKGLINYLPGNEFKISSNLSEEQKKALEKIEKLIKKFGSTGLQNVLNHAVFNVLNYIPVYPVEDENKLTDSKGNILPNVFLVKSGSTVLDLAYKVHSDFGENFIYAIDVRKKMRIGKDYILKNKDIIKIVASK